MNIPIQLHYRQNMAYLEITVETPVFDNLISGKCFDTNHNSHGECYGQKMQLAMFDFKDTQ